MELRPCEVSGLYDSSFVWKEAIFHRWVEKEEAVVEFDITTSRPAIQKMTLEFKENKVLGPGMNVKMINVLLALVEYKDGGYVDMVEPGRVRFLDTEECLAELKGE